MSNVTVLELAKMIDHSLLHPTLTDAQIATGLELARRCGCASACVKPYSITQAAGILRGSGVEVCAVAGFPHGSSQIAIKVAEAQRAIEYGATEVDCVVNVGKVLSADWTYVANEIKALNDTCVSSDVLLKVIFENDFLQDEHIIKLCQICTAQNVAYVKTSSGYGFVKQENGDYNYRGATDHHLKLMRQHSGPQVKIKAAGGVRTLDDLLRVRALGVARVGATTTEAILQEAIKRGLPGPLPEGLKKVPASTPVPAAAANGY